MKTSAPALLPILRSDAVGKLLARLYLVPDRPWTLSDLAEDAGVSLPTATREVTRMVSAGLLLEERVGKTRQIRANRAGRLFEPLRHLIALTYGPVPVLERELRGRGGVEKAFVYGSWAARHAGIPGPEPRDVDVLVVGEPDPDELFDIGERARKELHREVNIRPVRTGAWEDPYPTAPFLRQVRNSPLVELRLEGDA